ncbi:nucleoside hydrolase [Rhizosaccharibacter radicis]
MLLAGTAAARAQDGARAAPAADAGGAPMLVIEDNDFLGPGGSDIQSAIPLLANPKVKVLGFTVATGDGWENAEAAHLLRFLEIAKRTDVPVADGAVYPLINSVERMKLWEKQYGTIPWKGAWGALGSIDDVPHEQPPLPDLPEGRPSTRTARENAAAFLIREVHAHPHQVTIVETGPMTNLALAIRTDPTFAADARQLVFMGGLLDRNMMAVTGNADWASDFNFIFDPEAAHIALTAPWPRIVSLGNVADAVMMDDALMNRIHAVKTPVTDYLKRFQAPLPLWDEMATAVAVDPGLIRNSTEAFMDVDIADGPDYGRAHVWKKELAPRNMGLQPVIVVDRIDEKRFVDGFVRDAQRLGTPGGAAPGTDRSAEHPPGR